MKHSEIRDELIGQHVELRAMIKRTRGIAEATRVGTASVAELTDSVKKLTDAVRRHNLREEELLRDIIPTADAWGPMRAEVMSNEHVMEHEDLFAALLSVPNASPDKAASVVIGLLDRVIEHMNSEEVAFLSEELLRDDTVTTGHFGG
ncbi:MAG: hemerythrin domain-containing protein [Polyangiales bacterium]